jgi:hypothetical protein
LPNFDWRTVAAQNLTTRERLRIPPCIIGKTGRPLRGRCQNNCGFSRPKSNNPQVTARSTIIAASTLKALARSFANRNLRFVEEAEVPLEKLHEEIHHRAGYESARWISWVALSTALLAVLAAIAGLLSGSHANEAMMKQIEASDQWGYYQAKSIKAAVLDAKTTMASNATDQDKDKAAKYQEEESGIKHEAEQTQAAARKNFHQHEIYARAVTMFQIAIAIAAISALTKRPPFWFVSLVFGVAGAVFLVLGATAG